jgi:pyruvate dehydrogenase E2 component (dihydrolipoamide acetyltransferase)
MATVERLDWAERWLRDGLRVLRPAVSVLQVSADMTEAVHELERLRRQGVRVSLTHLVIHAAARALADTASVHQIVAGNTRHRPDRVDIGISVTGETFVAPVMVIEGADRKSVADIAEETTRRAPEVQAADRRLINTLRRWGWIVPVGVLRRAILRALFASPAFRQKGAGTFQVSTVPGDWAMTTSFATAGVLVAGQMRPGVVVVDGRPAVRTVMTLTLSGDHAIWDGRAAARFMAAVKSALESPAGEHAARVTAPSVRSAAS